MAFYAEATHELKRELGEAVPREEVKGLHQKRPLLHLSVAAGLVAVLAGSSVAILKLSPWYLWLPFAIVSGFAIFNFTVLLHEVVHRTVFSPGGEKSYRLLALLYAVPSGISASQFTRWHLDHHAGLGSSEEDPKRHYLSPKRNARWLKLLYFTPALFAIYFRAARLEAAAYPAELRKRINLERNLTIAFHLTALALLVLSAGWLVAWKVYLVPYFFVFPVAFALNRLGQHYDIDPVDPAQWSTLVKGSLFWDVAFLWSNYHLEHHYFPSVPFYNLGRLQKVLMPFYERHGMRPRSYGELFWHYIVLNRQPHTKWSTLPASDAALASQ